MTFTESASVVSAEGLGAVELRNLTVRFGGVTALKEVTAQFPPGRITGIIGPNGAGKTTLINAVSGLIPTATGQVLVDGRDISRLAAHRRSRIVGRTFQTCQLVDELGLAENILIGRNALMRQGLLRSLLPFGSAAREESTQRTRAEELMEFVGLSYAEEHRVSELTLGEQRLVEIARALALEPHILILDEPTAGLSLSEKDRIAALMFEMEKTMQLTQLLIEHDMRFVRSVCPLILALDFGTVLAFGPTDRILADSRVVEAYLGGAGSSAMAPSN